MGTCTDHAHSHSHEEHNHDHAPGCGHVAIEVNGDVCYLHDGHMHHQCDGHVHCASIEFSAENPDGCAPVENLAGHEATHVHGDACGHEKVPHGDHFDFLVGDELHHEHNGHCDNHGKVKIII